MKNLFLTAGVIIITSIFIGACHKKTITQSAGEISSAKNEVRVDKEADMSLTGAPYRIDSLSIKGDSLSVFVNYSGGCKEHVFELISNGMYAKSMPPQLTVCLKHQNNEDMCRKLVMQELKFNIGKVKYQGSKTLVVKLADKSVHYTY